jgi:magnesium chelatase family protein
MPGELSLDGRITAVAGVCPRRSPAGHLGRGIVCPAANGGEAVWAGRAPMLAADHLVALINHWKGTQVLTATTCQLHDL